MEDYINYGIITLLPPIIIITFAVITRKTFEALLIGGVVAYVITAGAGFLPAYVDAIFGTMADNVWMILVIGLFGSLISLLERSGGAIGFSKFIAKFANTPKKTLMASYLMGIAIFVDDYLNVLAIGTAMLPLADKQKVPREMMAYVIASTGASDCTVIPVSTWVVFYAGIFATMPELASYGAAGTGMEMYYHMVPTIFYGWTCLIVVPLVISGVIPIFGPMRKAYQRVAATGMVYSTESAKYNDTDQKEEDLKGGNLWFFVAPILLLVAVTLIVEDLLYGLIAGILLIFIMVMITRKISFSEVSDAVFTGFGSMTQMIFITVAALTVKTAFDQLNLPNYVIEAVLPFMSPLLFPAITFILVAGLAFITGSCWGIPAVCAPILMPLALVGGANVILTASAIVSGGVFGSHACFYSDCTVLTSRATKIEVMEHNLTQIPYALISAALAIILYLIFGILNISF